MKPLRTEKIGVVGRLASSGNQAGVPDVSDERQVERFEDLVGDQRTADGVRSALLEHLLSEFRKPLTLVGTQGPGDLELGLLLVSATRGRPFSLRQGHASSSRKPRASRRTVLEPSGVVASSRTRSDGFARAANQDLSRG